MRIKVIIFISFISIGSIAQSFEERYRQFQQQAEQDYTDFRTEANQQYAEFLRSAWEYYSLAPAIPQPKEEQVPPVVYDEEGELNNQEGQKEHDGYDIPYDDIVPQTSPVPQPQPISPIIQHDENETVAGVDFYGTSLSFRFPKTSFALQSHTRCD